MNTTKTTKADGEYRVRLFVNGGYQAGADYFTTDKDDAKDTAAAMVRNGGISDKTTAFAVAEQADFDNDLEIYDVCNDYSLDTLTTDFTPADYTTRNAHGGIVYQHKDNREIHYFKGPKGLAGSYI